ncbi:MAG: sulfatase [Thermoanaerobaculales bacterium]|jgi:hypothetical protein|nr:sulfatase [Thermoanaerobaculales bacterium]
MSVGRRSQWFCLVGLIAVLVGAVSCSEGPEVRDLDDLDDIGPLFGRYVPDRNVEVFPGDFWELDDDVGHWSFRAWSEFVVHVDGAEPAAPLNITLVPDEPTSAMRFRAKWDGVDRPDPVVAAGDGLVVAIPAAELTPGVHHLRIERVGKGDPPELRDRLDCRFVEVAFSVDGAASTLRPGLWSRYRTVRSFLDDGVTGTDTRRRGGLLVSGSRELRFALTTEHSGELRFAVSTVWSSSGRFVAEVAGERRELRAAQDESRLVVPVPAGGGTVVLRTSGEDDGLYLWGAPVFRPSREDRRGSVVLITLDTTRRDVLSVYGGAGAVSPSIAALAERATVYENAWSTSPWTLPSHASIFTGLYPTRHGAAVSKTRLEAGNETLAAQARRAGFRTAGFSGGALSASRWGLARGFELYRDPDGFETKGDRQTGYVEEFLDTIDGEAFFLFVNYFDPHAMFEAPEPFEARFGVAELRSRLEGVPGWDRIARGDSAAWREVISGDIPSTPDAVAYLKAAYQAEVAFMDHQIGAVLESLTSRGLFEDATIILVADHGELLGEGGFFSHGCRLDPELTEVPLIIKWPGRSKAERDHRLVSQVDLYGTVLAALGIEGSPRDGIPIGGGDRGRFDVRETVFMEEHESRVHPLFENMAISGHIYGLQQLDWRQLVWSGGTSCADRSAGGWIDSGCEVDWETRLEELAAVAALPTDHGPSMGASGLTEEMREQLEALGYVH